MTARAEGNLLTSRQIMWNKAYISFDRSIAAKNESTYDAWMRVEGLLKTIRAANLGISRVNFFVHHQPLVDAHLDFSKSWPIHGFVNAEKN